jgi:hypothetical protein
VYHQDDKHLPYKNVEDRLLCEQSPQTIYNVVDTSEKSKKENQSLKSRIKDLERQNRELQSMVRYRQFGRQINDHYDDYDCDYDFNSPPFSRQGNFDHPRTSHCRVVSTKEV